MSPPGRQVIRTKHLLVPTPDVVTRLRFDTTAVLALLHVDPTAAHP
ncbi:MAG: hypothetical protein ACRCY8_01765 [Dermatophilaceae bacterium]